MIQQSINRLQHLCDSLPSLLSNIGEPAFSSKPSPEKWSKKEVLGHLIDSATNNHQRFVRAQFEETPAISYDQNNWNKFNFYNDADGKQLIVFWFAYNLHLLHIMRSIPAENLQKTCNSGGSGPMTLAALIDDYVAHMEHHLKQIVDYK